MNFPIAICNELFEGWSISKICRFCRPLGYEGLELAPFTLGLQPNKLEPSLIREFRQTVADEGMQIVGLHWLLAKTTGLHLTSPDKLTRRKTAEYLAELVELCTELGGRVLVFGSPQQRSFQAGDSHADAAKWGAETLSLIVPILERTGVVLAIEPLGPEETNFLQTAASAVEFIGQLDSNNVRLHLDVKAMSTEAIGISDILRQHGPFLAHFHANDPNRLGPGMGSVDYRTFWSTLIETGYRGWLSVEVFDFSPGPEAIASKSIAYLNRLMSGD
jgi:sugar phosphate isomerase/epimerase